MSPEDIQDIKNRFGIIGNDDRLNRAVEVAYKVASTDLSVLVTGESGVGKEFFPKIIHQFSDRKHGPYIPVNCGAIPEGTVDSELFGHEKGSFTGAVSERKGFFEVADGGTIFLDEVGELPLTTQVRLLRVLETGEFLRVGSSKPIKTNVRVVAATNLNMEKAVKNGTFREDLYYRLNTISIQLPSLRERGEDAAFLFRKFALNFAEKYSTRIIRLLDGVIESDDNLCTDEEILNEDKTSTQEDQKEKAKMSFWTAFKLSARNLLSKFKRTLLVGLAGSIGIIGVSCVLALSSGITDYINLMQEDMLSGNPITITETTYDINAMMGSMTDLEQTEIVLKNGIVSINSILESLAKRAETMESIMVSNEISQEYIDYLKAMPDEYLEALSFNYGIDISNNIYTNFYEDNNF